LIVMLTLSMAAPIGAQDQADGNGGTEATKMSADNRADALEAKAAKLHDKPARYAEAAWMYREAAALRPYADARAVEALATAARLYGYANRFIDARKTMEQAAQRALARGDVVRASQANLDAAFFAAKQGKTGLVQRLARNALNLAESPLINAEQREDILRRIKSASPAVAGALE
jgi:hypothetical protein